MDDSSNVSSDRFRVLVCLNMRKTRVWERYTLVLVSLVYLTFSTFQGLGVAPVHCHGTETNRVGLCYIRTLGVLLTDDGGGGPSEGRTGLLSSTLPDPHGFECTWKGL